MFNQPKKVAESESRMTEEMKAEGARIQAMLFDGAYTDEQVNLAVNEYNSELLALGLGASALLTRDKIPSWKIEGASK